MDSSSRHYATCASNACTRTLHTVAVALGELTEDRVNGALAECTLTRPLHGATARSRVIITGLLDFCANNVCL